jgi:hypothetical protein
MGGNFPVGGSVPYLLRMCRTVVSLFLSLSRLCLGALTTHVGLAVVLGLAVILVVRYSKSPWRRVPPGPRGLPLLGNALELKDKDWLFRRDCKEEYSAFSLYCIHLHRVHELIMF